MRSRLHVPPDLPYPTFIEKEAIQHLPVTHYNGFIHLISDSREAERVCELIAREALLGFDTETKPTFRKGQSFLPSLVQIATSDAVYLFQLTHMALPEGLKRIFSDSSIIKAGAALDFDVKKASRTFTICSSRFC
ncbi:hypothetical protein [Chrysiogenes arsenatis]|uniref:hypothetical protein n=1 Tax=Chrysiogenes arsenatis TaxID=309797 RepID=UPI00040C21B5|nr:hypothetical protein [Chrysiogenes arsenatis]